MKTIKFAIGLIAIALSVSCGPKPQNTGTPVPVDSTNVHGTAPVEYGAQDPTEPRDQYKGAYDTGKRANTMNHEDSVREGIISK